MSNLSKNKPSRRFENILRGTHRIQVETFAPNCRSDIRYGGSIVYRLYDRGVKIAIPIRSEMASSRVTGMTHYRATMMDRGVTLNSIVGALGVTETDLALVTPTDLGRRSGQVRIRYEIIDGDKTMKITPVVVQQKLGRGMS